MALSKKERQAVAAKCNGRCALCGTEINKGLHMWAIEPLRMIIGEGGLSYENETVENHLPACKSCYSLRTKYRGEDDVMDLERFRKEVARNFEFLRYGGLTSTAYGQAVRFGFIIETNKPVVFYFETLKQAETSA